MSELRNSRSGPIKIQQFGATDENIARLINQDWDELASLVVLSQSSVPLEMLPEMAETLSEFMKAHDLLEQFLKWCIEQEVSSTKEFNLLFREDSFVIMLLNRLVFGDLGIKYLSGVLQNLITSIIKHEKPLELNRMKVNDEEWSANVQVIMKFLGDFLPHFAKSARLCPIPMRYTFSCLQSAVDHKFGKQETPFALEFIFFHYICPAVINPKKYDLVKEAIPIHALPGLIATSKLLNDLAMNATDKWKEKEVSDFILKRHPMLLQHLHLLTDEKDIANTKQMISSSVSTSTATVEERQRAANRWKQFLTALAYYHRKGSMTSMTEETKLFPQSQEMFQLKQLEFLNLISSSDWTLEKDKPMLISQIKDKERPAFISCKCECIIECPLPLVYAAIKEFQFHKKTDSFISQVESLFVSQFYSENYLVYRLPFPLNNRDLVFYQWEYEEDTRCCIVQENLSGKVQRKKGMVRAQMLLSGWLVERVESHLTRVVRVSQLDPKGSLPQWISNAMASSQSSKLGYLKELVEKRSRKGSIKRDSRSSRDSRASRDSGTWDYL